MSRNPDISKQASPAPKKQTGLTVYFKKTIRRAKLTLVRFLYVVIPFSDNTLIYQNEEQSIHSFESSVRRYT